MAAPFKAYDIRGIVGEELTPERAHLIGRALAQEIFATEHRGPVMVSRDMRSHSPQLSAALLRGLSEGGCPVLDIGLCATPMNYWANVHYRARGSVMVTASHNGPRYNGFKVSAHHATPVDFSSGLDRVEKQVHQWENHSLPPATSAGEIRVQSDALSTYLDWMDGFLVADGQKLRIGIDASNGMAGLFLPDWFAKRSWLEAAPLFWELDGNFPNHEADPLKAENLRDVQALVTRENCDFGACFDGDADRCMFVDENGAAISSDLITALIAEQVLAEAPGGPILYDLRSSRVVPQHIERHGGQPVRERVGHSFMKRTLRRLQARFGGELSGHYYFADCFDTDSGLMALVQIVNILQKRRQPLSQLIAPLQQFSATGEINFRVPDTQHVMQHVASTFQQRGAQLDTLDGLTVNFDDWWFNLRSSNTEPLLRLNLEASTPAERTTKLQEVQDLLFAHGATFDAGAH